MTVSDAGRWGGRFNHRITLTQNRMPPVITTKTTVIPIQAAIERPPWTGLKNQRQPDRRLPNEDRHTPITRLESAGYVATSLLRSAIRAGDSRIRIAPPTTTPRATSQVIGQPASSSASATHAWISSTENPAAFALRSRSTTASRPPGCGSGQPSACGEKPEDSAQKTRAAVSTPTALMSWPRRPAASRRQLRYSCSGVPRHPVTTPASRSTAENQIHRFIGIPPRPRWAVSDLEPTPQC